MAIVAQLVRAPVCGTGGRRFKSGLSPHFFRSLLVCMMVCGLGTAGLRAGLFEKKPPVLEELNLAYGEHPRQVLDLVRQKGSEGCPVVLFLHGGSWRWGGRTTIGQLGSNSPGRE